MQVAGVTASCPERQDGGQPMTTAQRITCPKCQGLMEFRRDFDGPYLACYLGCVQIDLFDSQAEQARRDKKRQENAHAPAPMQPEPAPALPPMPDMPDMPAVQGVAWLQKYHPGLPQRAMALHLGISVSRVNQILTWKPRITNYVLNPQKMRELRDAIPAHDKSGKAKVVLRQAVSRMSNISTQVLADVEAGRRVTPRQAQKLADFYGLALDSLVAETIWSKRVRPKE